jgi:DNA-binding XRE family transcriptional regulator
MLAEMRINTMGGGFEEISLSVPKGNAVTVAEVIRGVLALAGHNVRQINDADELVNAEDVFPDASPAMALRGFRGKLELTQQELAEKLGTTQNCISDMESGKRSISRAMARRLGEFFEISYKAFL